MAISPAVASMADHSTSSQNDLAYRTVSSIISSTRLRSCEIAFDMNTTGRDECVFLVFWRWQAIGTAAVMSALMPRAKLGKQLRYLQLN